MAACEPSLPPSFREECLEQTDSTNAEAIRRLKQGEPGNLWIRATRQSAGRGRSGRHWVSPEGNLYASLLLRPACTLETALHLAFLAGIALYETAAGCGGRGLIGSLTLKWPNDLLLDGKKAGGILLESRKDSSAAGPAVVIGSGLNLASHPGETTIPATHLSAHGAAVASDDAFYMLAQRTAHWLDIWADGQGWSDVRKAWIEHSFSPGTAISVTQGDRLREGYYAGIDEAGALLLDTGSEGLIRITAGDVFAL